MIKDNVFRVLANIEKAEQKTDSNEKVRLIAVSKTKPVSMMKEVIGLGIKSFGENKVQELVRKWEHFEGSDIEFHMIGHLQRNKVKYIVDKVKLIHSVDSIRLAREIQKEALKKQVCVDILIQINIGEESTKFGITTEQVLPMIKEISNMANVKVRGIMCIAPYVENPEDNRELFRNMYDIFVDIKRKKIHNVYMDILSMGMSNDYEVAIEEGANMVRVGSAIFGERNYNK